MGGDSQWHCLYVRIWVMTSSHRRYLAITAASHAAPDPAAPVALRPRRSVKYARMPLAVSLDPQRQPHGIRRPGGPRLVASSLPRIRLSELSKNIQGLPGKTGACLLSPVDTGRRQRLPTRPTLLKPFGGMRRIGAAEHFITLGERIVAIKILFAGLDHVEQMHRGLLAKRCPASSRA